MEALFARGVGFGLIAAAALGPIGLLVIRRTLARGRAHGLASGLGVAAADATYAGVAAFGLSAIAELLVGADAMLGVAGGAVLVVLGTRALGSSAAAEPRSEPAAPAGLAWAAASILGLTLANPMTILTFVALFAGLRAGSAGMVGAIAVTAGVFLGSLAWWVALTTLVAALRRRLTTPVVRSLNVASGLAIVGFGIVAVAAGVQAA
jgi:threonine/homoserine/homoserine lactone efflux protein